VWPGQQLQQLLIAAHQLEIFLLYISILFNFGDCLSYSCFDYAVVVDPKNNEI
jgi:hypothetical protein